MKIVINAGHGEHDPGAIGPTGLKEAEQNLDIAKRLRDKLLKQGHEVLLIHKASLWDVSNQANKYNPDYFISIHANAHTNRQASGIETYCYKFGGMGEKIARAVQTELIEATGLIDRGVKEGNLHVLRETKAPAILVEVGFISNPEEEALMKTEEFRKKVAQAIYIGLGRALGWEEVKVAEKSLKEKLAPDDTYLTVRVRESKVEEAIKEINKLGYACKKLDLA